MIILLAQLALAVPPLPTWGAEDRQVPDVELPEEAAPTAQERVASGRRTFQPAEPSPNGWASEADLVVSIAGDVGKLYYIMGTVQGPGLVVHTRQGPIAGENLSVDVPVELPVGLHQPLTEVGSAHLSLRLAITTLDDQDLGQQGLARTQIAMEGSRPVGAAPIVEDEIMDDSEFDAPDTETGAP